MGKISITKTGIGFFGLLQIAFIVLKLCKVIKWSWWLVLLPLWVDIGLIALCIIITIYLFINVYKN